ncbi:MAG: hypothetical protein WC851_00590 [Candidatus Shapirobacteria bacterium]|jgi:hypothetical protein
MKDLPITNEAQRFSSKLEISSELKRPEWTVSPLAGHLSLEVTQDIPIGGVTDTHLSGTQASSLGVEGMTSGKRLVAAGIKIIRGRTRWLDGLSGFTFRKGMEQVRTKYEDKGMTLILGDTVDASEAGAAFESYSAVQQRLGSMATGKDESGFTSIVLSGNHNAFSGSEKAMAFDPMRKMFGRTMSTEEFTDVTDALKQGVSWSAIRRKWGEYKNQPDTKKVEKVAIHPLQKWYMEQLSFGDQIGIVYQKENDQVVNQAVFIDTLLENGGNERDLNEALQELGLKNDSGIGGEMAEHHRMLREKQETTFNSMIENLNLGVHTVIYTHETALAQEMLIKRLVVKNGIEEEEAKRIVENNVLTVGGHRHTAEYDLVKPNKGTLTVRGISRQFVGPIAQAPISMENGLMSPFTLKKPFSSKFDYPEILTGTIFHPKTEKIENVVQDFDKLIKSVGGK